ncbi:TPA: H-NS family nucleoid-associated regulatory protein [Pseudomonas putida]
MSSTSGLTNAGMTKRKTETKAVVPGLVFEFVALGEKPPRGAARYKDPANPFNTWAGRGKRPSWLRSYLEQGRLLEEFESTDDSED